MADYQLISPGGVLRRADGAHIPPDPANTDFQTYLAWDAVPGNDADPADPPPLQYVLLLPVHAQTVTTDAAPIEVFRFPCEAKHLYQADLLISGVDRANFATKIMEGRFTWKRPAAVAVVVGLTVVSDIHDAAAASWAPNYAASGTDVVFTVAGAAGRTIDWVLTGRVGAFAPAGM